MSVVPVSTATGTVLPIPEIVESTLTGAFLTRPNDDDDDDGDADAFVGISSVTESNRDVGRVVFVVDEVTAFNSLSRSRFFHSDTSIRPVLVPDPVPV